MTYKITSDKQYQKILKELEALGVLWSGGATPTKMSHLFNKYGAIFLKVNNKVLTWRRYHQEANPRMSWEDEGISKDTGRAYTTVVSMDRYFG